MERFFSIYIALMLQNVVTISVNLADNIMLGSYSETALSGAAAVNQIQFVFQQIIMALGDGLVIFCSQYWGKKQIKPMKRIAASATHIAIFIAVLLFGAVTFFSESAIRIFTEDKSIISEGMAYLDIIRFTYLLFAITQLLLAILRSTETVKIAFQLSILAFCVNCGINYILIFGNFGAPRMGIRGAAIGTLAARITELTVLLIYIVVREDNLHLQLKDYLRFNKVITKDYFGITWPMLIVQGLWGISTALQTVILGHMTASAIAANSVASTLFLLVKSAAVGAAATASIIIGKTIGEGNIEKVKETAKQLQKVFLKIGVLSGLVLFLLRNPVLSFYNLQPETKEMANTFLIILSVICVGMSYQMPVNNGIIRGGGNVGFTVKVDLISIWLIVLPLSFVMAFIVKASPVIVVCCLNADQIFKCVPAFIKVNYGNWIRELTREQYI